MSKSSWRDTDDRRGQPEDIQEAPTGQVNDDSYTTTKGNTESVPVVSDEAAIRDPVRPSAADSDKQLERDDQDAIDKQNVLKDRLRGNKPKPGELREPEDSELGLADEEMGR
ncbi:hypothetical protein O1611_g6952 [Lasiodiplodia mahajangana]|uniref:Uncharacterized protein n=1 Tax=Lasiodiplodia mahajangana TaxID=1108764 RepID=A0ACC2JGY0_9PEZI|nr:hypothetical protein O1611_g6952 [Lasiodiplodia mahajangana]